MQWKNIYWLYIVICLLLIAGIIVGLVFGLRTSSSTPIVIPTVTTVLIILKEEEKREPVRFSDFRELPPTEQLLNIETFSDSPTVEPLPSPATLELGAIPDPCETIIPMCEMATSSQIYQDVVLIGAPKEDDYGKVFVYQIEEHCVLKEIHEISFSMTGTPYQLAGYAIESNIVCAPEFGIDQSVKPGAFFVLRELAGDLEIQRESVDLKDGFVMKKRGRIFRYQHPYLYVAKDNGMFTVIDMFQMDENQTNWKFVKRGPLRPTGNLFANEFILNKNLLIVSELNVYYIYNALTLQQIRMVDISGEYKDDLDLKQTMQISPECWLIINSPLNQFSLFYDENMKLVKCERFVETGNCTRYRDSSGKTIVCDFDQSKIMVFNGKN